MKSPFVRGLRPRWDGSRRQLRLSGKLLREFLRDAPDQIRVLEMFETKSWPPRIEVRGLIPAGASGKGWVKHTVENLNRSIPGLRFHGNGANCVIGWQLSRKK